MTLLLRCPYLSFVLWSSVWSFFSGSKYVQVFFYRLFIMYVLPLDISCFVCPKSEPGCPTSYVAVLFLCSVMSLVKMKGDCLFCLYWWHWWRTLFKLSFYNLVLGKNQSYFVNNKKQNNNNNKKQNHYDSDKEFSECSSFLFTTYSLCLMDVFSTDSRHSCGF